MSLGRPFRDSEGEVIRLLSLEWDFVKPRKPGKGKTFAKMTNYEIDMARWKREMTEIEAYETAKQRAIDVSGYERAQDEIQAIKRKMGSLNVELARCDIKTMEGLRRKARALCWWCSNDRAMLAMNPLSVWMLASLLDDILRLGGQNDYNVVRIMDRLKPQEMGFWIESSGNVWN